MTLWDDVNNQDKTKIKILKILPLAKNIPKIKSVVKCEDLEYMHNPYEYVWYFIRRILAESEQ